MTPTSAHNSPVQVKRARRTYGRPKEPEDPIYAEANAPFLLPSASLLSTSLISDSTTVGPVARPPTSPTDDVDPEFADDEDEHSKRDTYVSFGSRFAWKDRLKELDRDSDDDEVSTPATGPVGASNSGSTGPEIQTATIEPFTTPPRLTSTPHSASRPIGLSPSKPRSPPAVSGKKTVIVDSEESDFDNKARRKSPFSSPSKEARKESSPPTSDHELPADVLAYPLPKIKAKSRTATKETTPHEPDQHAMVSKDSKARHETKLTKTKIKAPTKKELAETDKDRFRIGAEQRVSLEKKTQGKYTLTSLFENLKESEEIRGRKAHPLVPASSDSIMPFSEVSSSPGVQLAHSLSTSMQPLGRRHSPPPLKTGQDDSDSDLPEAGDIMRNLEIKKMQKALAEKKRLAMAASKRPRQDDSDDDLEIVQSKPVATGHSANTSKRATLPVGLTSKSKPPRVAKAEEDAALARRIKEINAGMTKSKEEEWLKRGGRLLENPSSQTTLVGAMVEMATKGLAASIKSTEESMAMEAEDESGDEEWQPEMRGSASPEPDSSYADKTLVDEDEDPREVSTQDVAEDEVEEQDENVPRGKTRRRNAVYDSDDENERDDEYDKENNHFMITGSEENSSDFMSTGGEDKENNGDLMYDEGEDKENNTDATRPSLSRHGSMRTFASQLLSMSPTQDEFDDDDGKDNVGPTRRPFGVLDEPFPPQASPPMRPASRRIPFGTLSEESIPSQSSPLTNRIVPFAVLREEESTASQPSTLQGSPMLLPSPSIKPFALGEPWREEGSGAATLGTGFSQLFRSGTQQQPTEKASGFGGLLNKGTLGDALELSQDTGARPALQASARLQKQAESIFEDEQRYVVETADRHSPKRDKVYVNEHGFLTQTHPSEEAQAYSPMPTPSQPFLPLSLHQKVASNASPSRSRRPPLRTLSFSGSHPTETSSSSPNSRSHRPPLRTLSFSGSHLTETSSSSPHRMTRLRRGISPSGGYRSSPSPPAVESRAEIIEREMKRAEEREVRRLEREARRKEREAALKEMGAEFFEYEAQESDEEAGFLGLGKATDEEEEDGDHLDESLRTLVDDTKMDDSTVAAEKVIEKFQEQQHEDDQAVEKLHRDVVNGVLRQNKRKGAHGFVDSDDEDEEDEHNAEVRRRMNKKTRIDRADIKAFEGTAFYTPYATGIQDDDREFAYLQTDGITTTPDVVPMDADEDEYASDASDSNKYISREEIQTRVRQLAEDNAGGVMQQSFDGNDVSWIDDEADDFGSSIKVVNKNVVVRRNRRVEDQALLDGFGIHKQGDRVGQRDQVRMQQWARNESRTRVGTGRSAAGAAVTGHRKKVKAGEGSLGRGTWSSQSQDRVNSRPVKAQPSLLAEIDRKARTGRF